MAKINIRNIILVLGVTVFDVVVGFCDRIINGIGIIKSLAMMAPPTFAGQIEASMPSTDMSIMMVNTGTAFNFLALGLFVLAATFVIAIISSTLGAAGRG